MKSELPKSMGSDGSHQGKRYAKGWGSGWLQGPCPSRLGKKNMIKDHFFLGTPDCTDFVSGKVRKYWSAMSFQRSFAQIKWDWEEAINFQFKSQ